jgi:translation initiation factor IF-3
LKFNCDNKGICCNINHYEKYKYSKNNGVIKREQKKKEPKKEIKEITITSGDDSEKLIIDFDSC